RAVRSEGRFAGLTAAPLDYREARRCADCSRAESKRGIASARTAVSSETSGLAREAALSMQSPAPQPRLIAAVNRERGWRRAGAQRIRIAWKFAAEFRGMMRAQVGALV